MTEQSTPILFAGTHRRAHRADSTDIAFGIYAFRVEQGRLSPLALTRTPQPGWVAVHPGGHFLYCANELREMEGREGGAVSAFRIDLATGALDPLNSRPLPPMPCHCAVDATGRFLLVATFGGGSVHLFAIEDDGRIGAELDAHVHHGSSIDPRRQAGPHAHAVAIDPGNRFVLVPDLGTDSLYVYALDREGGRLAPLPERTLALAAGSGPRHLAFGSGGWRVYLMNEMSATIAVLAFDPETGALDLLQSIDLLPAGFAGLRSGAAVAIHPRGDFLYATTRSHGSSGEPPVRGLDLLVWFSIDRNGLLVPGGRVPAEGQIPRSFTLDPAGDFLFVGHQCSGTIATFRIDSDGAPAFTGQRIATPVPVCLEFAAPG